MLLATSASAILNNPLTAKLPLPINITALLINVTAPFINIIASSIDITASPINALNIQLTEAKVITNYSRDLATLAKIYTKESKYSKNNKYFNYKLIIFNNFYNKISIP